MPTTKHMYICIYMGWQCRLLSATTNAATWQCITSRSMTSQNLT